MQKVKMKFKDNKYYNDLSNPHFYAGKVYEIEDKDVQRWLNRGGEIVDGSLRMPKVSPKEILEAKSCITVDEDAPKHDVTDMRHVEPITQEPSSEDLNLAPEAEERLDEEKEVEKEEEPTKHSGNKKKHHFGANKKK